MSLSAKERVAIYRKRHPERCRAATKRWKENNPEAVKAMGRRYYAKHREKKIAKQRDYYLKHSEERKRYAREYAKRKRKEQNANSRAWRAKNIEKSRASKRLWRDKNPEVLRAYGGTRRAMKCMATPPWLNISDVKPVYAEAVKRTLETGIKHAVDHIYPLKHKRLRGLHVPWNLRVLTASENSKKHNKLPSEVA